MEKKPISLLVSETTYLRSLPRTHEHRWGSEHRSSGKSRALPSILRQSPTPCFTHLWTRPLRACLRLDLSPEWEWAEDQGQDVFIVLKFDFFSFLKNDFIWIHIVEDYVSTFLSNCTASTWSLTVRFTLFLFFLLLVSASCQSFLALLIHCFNTPQFIHTEHWVGAYGGRLSG